MALDAVAGKTEGLGSLIRRHPLTSYFAIAFLGTWVVEAIFLLSRDGLGLLPYRSPLEQFTTVSIGTFSGPAMGAFVVTAVIEGKEGVARLARRIVLWRAGLIWYLFVLVGLPAIQTLGTIVLPGVLASATAMSVLPELASYAVFFVYPALIIGGPLGEEIGWRGFALPRLQEKFGPMMASLLLGVLWAFWHWPIWISGQWAQPTLGNIATYIFWITAANFIYTWVFNNTRGSILMAILVHASMDAFPNAILWAHFPEVLKMTSTGVLYGYWGLVIGFGVFATLLALGTRGRLGLPG
jgi:membrane protease YdiL (CAAX protease family)